VRRVEGLEAPLIEIWGWPGSGSPAVLNALAARPGAAGLTLADLADEAATRRALAAASAARWLVVAGDPGERLTALAQGLRPGQQLVFASSRRHHDPALPAALVTPQELLLTIPEVSQLWHLLIGRQPAPSASLALWRATEGWYRPLRLALEATGGVGLDAATAEQLLEIAPVRLFLRHEVLDSLGAAERERLLDAPRQRPAVPAAPAAAGWQVVEELGLWVEGGDHDRLPVLLAAWLDRERRRRRLPAGGAMPAGAGAAAGSRAAARTGRGAAVEGEGEGEERRRPTYRLRLFGGPLVFQVGAEGEREVGWKLRRSFQVLAFLAASPDLQASRDDLEEAVWPADGERTIDRNFHPTLSHLRRALDPGRRGTLPPPLLLRGGIYRLNPEIEWEIDLQEFNRRVAEGRELAAGGDERAAADTWQRAWRLYHGPFLHGYYEAWVVARREEVQQAYLELLRDVGDLAVRLERAEDAVDAYRSLLLEDPLQERTHLAVMRLYAGQGRRDLVRRQYERLCTLLLDELGVEPLPETVQEYHRLMS
jgi:DNA-binding SARP family transcriptional activator